MPTRNQARYLRAAVGSVMADGIDTLLFVQDGASTDGTCALLSDMAATNPRMDVVSEPDDGPADALNRAFGRALRSGAPVLGWLNSDDLYTPGALQRALAHFERNPGHLAVYGEAEHVDAEGRRIGRYPTRPPGEPLALWQQGCPICQPTVFLRREALQSLLPLDTGLRTAFDFELWLRLFKRDAGRIGFIPAVQAQSRLHAEGITLRLREQVALEGMAVVHRHLGVAAPHWLLTHAAEALARCPFDAPASEVQHHLLELVRRSEALLGPKGTAALAQQLRQSLAWRLADAGVGSSVQADGWAGPVLDLRLHQRDSTQLPWRSLRLEGRHAWPRPGRLLLHLTAWLDGVAVARTTAWWRRGFALDIPLPATPAGRPLHVQVRCDGSFVPAEQLRASTDTRQLAYRLERLQPQPA